MGAECARHGVSTILGPGMNIKRNALCGRNFEYYSEDPVITGELASEFILGLKEKGVCACPKHYALNNQEKHRLDRLPIGTVIEFSDGEKTVRLEKHKPAYQFKAPFWWNR